ncbi:MAG: hypothetical protein LBS90_08695 [Oscillospiraceae bacterium]|jgi:hypothetical protein|nr:hypothetical protein [Oscillospiraceae bacterium]
MKKIAAFILALTLAASLFACGKKSTAPTTSGSEAKPDASPSSEASPAPATPTAIPDYITIKGAQYSTSLTSLDLDLEDNPVTDWSPVAHI